MNLKHTPGPWSIKWGDGRATIKADDGHGKLAVVYIRPSVTENVAEYSANADLIALAPDLAAKLAEIATSIEAGRPDLCSSAAQAALIRALLAKARL